jgi:uncharacterized membrane protein
VNIALWIAAGLLACLFLASGVQKMIKPDKLRPLSDNAVRWIGAAEIAAAAGLVLPFLTPLAATGLVLLMVGATVFHVRRGEVKALPVTVTLAAVAAVVAVGRFAQ